MNYGSASVRVADDQVFVLNGADSGNEIVRFDLTGDYLGKYPGWYNWPVDMTLGPNNQVLMSAIGAMGDDHMMRFGLVLYNRTGGFFHGFQEAETGMVRPYGLSNIEDQDQGSSSKVVVTDWGNNQTRILQVDWEAGNMTLLARPIITTPYPFRVVVNKDKILVASMVCCQVWQEQLKKVSLFDLNGSLLKELKYLSTGETLSDLQEVSVDPFGNYLVVDNSLNKTVVLNEELEYLGSLDLPTTPKSIYFYQNEMYTIEAEETEDDLIHRVKVYEYTQ